MGKSKGLEVSFLSQLPFKSRFFWNDFWVQTFHTTFFVKLKDQGFSDNKYCCEDDEVSGLGNLPPETILRVNKDHKPLWIIYFFPPGSLEKHTSELEETRQDSTPLTCMTILSLRWHKHIKVGKQSDLINGVKLSHKIYSVKLLSQGGE